MVLLIDKPNRDACPVCRSSVEKAGFICQDSEGVRRHLCSQHVIEILRVVLVPLRTAAVES
jgi:hypothetical protein